MIIVIGKRIYRFVITVLILALIVPVILFYALRAVDPLAVHYQKPRGDALKVSANAEDDDPYLHILPRILQYVHEFYQNGL